jgi:hypothetical protein
MSARTLVPGGNILWYLMMILHPFLNKQPFISVAALGNVGQGNRAIFHFFKEWKLSKTLKVFRNTDTETFQNQGNNEKERVLSGFNHPAVARKDILRKIARRIY